MTKFTEAIGFVGRNVIHYFFALYYIDSIVLTYLTFTDDLSHIMLMYRQAGIEQKVSSPTLPRSAQASLTRAERVFSPSRTQTRGS